MSTKIYTKGCKDALSTNFRVFEFDCPCDICKSTLVDDELVLKLETIRVGLGTPLKINSGYRCEDYQKVLTLRGLETATGTSQHSLGKAADVGNGIALGIELEGLARSAGFKAVGVGQHFIHVDLRNDKDRRWIYNY